MSDTPTTLADTTADRETLSRVPARWANPPAETLSRLDRGKGVVLDYMGHGDVTLALIDVDPGWSWAPTMYDDETGGPKIVKEGNRLVMWGRLTVCGATRLCVGTCQANKMEPEKELIGDLIRNGAMRFGIATSLWSKADGLPDHDDDAPIYVLDQFDDFLVQLKGYAGTPIADAMKALAAEHGKHLTANAFRSDPEWYAVAHAGFLAVEPADPAEYTATAQAEEERTATDVATSPTKLTESQRRRIMALSNALGLDRDDRLVYLSTVCNRAITSANELTKVEANKVIEAMTEAEAGLAQADALTAEEDQVRDEPF